MPHREPSQDVTALLQQWRTGDSRALDQLLPLVYDELRRVAGARLRQEKAGHTLQATALVHEAYLRLMGSHQQTPQNRTHLFAVAARLMREILVDHARRKAAQKRGGTATRIALDESVAAPEIAMIDLLALDEALTELHAMDPRLCQVVELKFFAGLNRGNCAGASHLDRDGRARLDRLESLASSAIVVVMGNVAPFRLLVMKGGGHPEEP